MKTLVVTSLFAVFLLSARGAETPKSILSVDLSGAAAESKILGPLGHFLGDFITVEGVPCAIGMGGRKKYSTAEDVGRHGIHSLEINKVNGKTIEPPVVLPIFGNQKFSPAAHFTLRGYQHGVFGPGNIDPETTGDFDLPQVTGYYLTVYFVATKEIQIQEK